MLKPKSPRVLLAAAGAALAVGLSSCATPQTLIPYTPAQGVNIDAPGLGAPPDSNAVPLKLRNLLIISTGEASGILSGAALAPAAQADRLLTVEGRPFTVDNVPAAQGYQPANPNLELPAGQLVVLTNGPHIVLSGSQVRPGTVAELKFTFEKSQQQLVMVPIVDGNQPEYRQFTAPTPGAAPAPGAAATPAAPPAPAAPGAPQPPAEPAPAPAPGQPG